MSGLPNRAGVCGSKSKSTFADIDAGANWVHGASRVALKCIERRYICVACGHRTVNGLCGAPTARGRMTCINGPPLVGKDEVLLRSDLGKLPFDWSRDGRYLLYGVRDNRTKSDLWVLPMTRERKPFVFANTEFDETPGQFSPDMRWVAYQSDESGATELHVQPFPRSPAAEAP